jgi:hypothetical protein
MTSVPTKICIDCGQVKPLADFLPNPRSPDGRLSKCKPCLKAGADAFRAQRALKSTMEVARP